METADILLTQENLHVKITETMIVFKSKDIGHFEFIPQGQTVNQGYYMEILKQLHEGVCRKRPQLWPNNWILMTMCHLTKHLVKQYLAQKAITEMDHPFYSPDLALNDFWLFPKIKSALKGLRFQDTEDI